MCLKCRPTGESEGGCGIIVWAAPPCLILTSRRRQEAWNTTWQCVAGPGSFLPLPALCGPRPSLAASRDLLLRVSTEPTPAGKEEAVGGGCCFRPPRQKVVGPGPGGTGETERLGQTGLHTHRTRWPCPSVSPITGRIQATPAWCCVGLPCSLSCSTPGAPGLRSF